MPRLLFLLCIAMLSLPFAGCGIPGFHSWNWHQKLELHVSTPSGDVTGSSIVSVTVEMVPRWWGVGDSRGAGTASLSGEAAVVKIAPGRYLFALLKGYNYETALRTFAADQMSGITEEELNRIFESFKTLRERRELPRPLYAPTTP